MHIRHLLPLLALAGIFTCDLHSWGRAPVATNDTYVASTDSTLTVSAPGVLGNDSDSNSHSLSVAPITSQTFTFDGITFEQALTPNLYQSLLAGNYSNAIVTAPPSTVASGLTGFPESSTGFFPSLSVGRQFEDSASTTSTKALNLPAGNLGASARSGFELGWGSGVSLTNLAGNDFVVFEAGSAGAPEAFMVQVRNATDGVWSSWVYIAPQSFKLYVGNGSEGLHSTTFNLDSFGIPSNGRVDAIRIVNITDEDRMQSAGEGVVLADDNGASSSIFPDPPGGDTAYLNGALDPDIVYVGVLHALGSSIPAYTATSSLGATVTVNSNGSFTYDPSTSTTLQAMSPGQSMDDTFTYLVTDNFSGHTKGLVTVTVSAPASGAPTLSITVTAGSAVIRWPNTPGFILESTPTLSTPVWTQVGTTPTEDGGDLTVTVDASTGMSFFRLSDSPEG